MVVQQVSLTKAFNQQAAYFLVCVAFVGKIVSLPLSLAALLCWLSFMMERKQSVIVCYIMVCYVFGGFLSL